jgi:c(7)-type cytochrome triheme protein
LLFLRFNLMLLALISFTVCAYAEQTCVDTGSKTMPDERYVIFGDEYFVRDRVSGLEWTRCAIGQSWDSSGKQCKEAAKKQVKSWFTYENAIKEVERYKKLTNDASWRLPTINELLTITEHRCIQPAINTAIFPNAPSWRFWSATSMVENDDYAWVVNFTDGTSSTLLKTIPSHYIRFVKGNPLLLNKPKASTEQRADSLQPWDDGIHDLANPDLMTLLPYADAITSLAKDNSGHPDWAKALNDKLITPRSSKNAEQNDSMAPWDQNIIYKDTATMPWVHFPHKTHSQWLACSNCHDEIFSSQGEKADISMASIYTGNHCGACHGRVAFNINTCERCHSILHDKVSENGRKMLSAPK